MELKEGTRCGAPQSMERGKMAEAESLETAAEHERILREIESTDTACIGPTLRYPGCRGYPRAGTSGTGGGLLRGCVSGQPSARPAPAPPFGELCERSPPLAGRVSLRSPEVGPLRDRRLPQPRYPEGASCLPPGWAAFVLPPRLPRRRAAGARRTDSGFYHIFP